MLGDDEAADVLRKVAREAEDLSREFDAEENGAIARVEADCAEIIFFGRTIAPVAEFFGHSIDEIERKAQSFANFTHGGAAAI